MLNTDQMEKTKLVLRELFELWESRAHTYGEVSFGAAIVNENAAWKNLFTYFLPLQRTDRAPSGVSADYKDFKILSGSLKLRDVEELLTKLSETNELSIPALPAVPLEASLYPGSSRRFCTSSEEWFPVGYPCFEYRWSIGNDSQGTLPQRTIYSINLPIYPGGKEAIEDLLRIQLGGRSGRSSDLVALAPDYRGRLSELRLSTRGVEVSIDCPTGSDDGDLFAKIYFEAPSGARLQGSLDFKDRKATFEADTFPRNLIVALASKSTGDLIDERSFRAGYGYTQAGIAFETTEQSIENLILAGESDTVEFKRELPKKREDLAVTISSFWNRLGGQILIGVENDGRIVGFEAQGIADTITNIVSDLCEPAVQATVKDAKVGDNRIVVVTVPEGKDKPCMVKGKGPYVRSGATSRPATRYELDEMYKDKNSGKRIFEL